MPVPAPHKTNCFIGIDPGQSGGLVYILSGWTQARPMPDTDLGISAFFSAVTIHAESENCSRFAVIEKVTSSPQMGVASAFTFGCGYGKLLMALTQELIQFEEVRPQVWQKALGIPPRKPHDKKKRVKNRKGKWVIKKYGGETDDQWKCRLRRKAQQLFPQLTVWHEPKYKQLAVADALLIATYCQRKHEGRL